MVIADPTGECISDPDIPNDGEEIAGPNLPRNADIRELIHRQGPGILIEPHNTQLG